MEALQPVSMRVCKPAGLQEHHPQDQSLQHGSVRVPAAEPPKLHCRSLQSCLRQRTLAPKGHHMQLLVARLSAPAPLKSMKSVNKHEVHKDTRKLMQIWHCRRSCFGCLRCCWCFDVTLLVACYAVALVVLARSVWTERRHIWV